MFGANGFPGALVRLAIGIAACCLSIYVGNRLLEAWEYAHISEPITDSRREWTAHGIYLLTGTAFGVAVGALFRQRPVRVAAVAAIALMLECVVIIGATNANPYVASAGLLAGALIVERLPAIERYRLSETARALARGIVIAFALVFAWLVYAPWRSHRVAVELCDSAVVGQRFDEITRKARNLRMDYRYWPGPEVHEFRAEGALGNYSSCQLKVAEGRVTYSKLSGGRALVWTIPAPGLD